MVAVVWGVYVVYIIETYGATSTVVAVVWGVYLAYIVNAYGATSMWWQWSGAPTWPTS